jgi:hypothetical protein
VIHAIYPDLSKAEVAQENYIQEVIKSYNVRKFGEIATKGAKQQKDQARKTGSSHRRELLPDAGQLHSAANLPLAKRPRNPNKPEAISFSLVQHPQLAASDDYRDLYALPKKFIRTNRYITVLLLKKWLQLKLVTEKERLKTEQTKKETEKTKTENGGTADMETETTGEQHAVTTAAESPPPVPTPVTPSAPPPRFLLYVRAFDTSLLGGASVLSTGVDGTAAAHTILSQATEVFVPLSSDLTLDYIEEYMWNSESQKKSVAETALAKSVDELLGKPLPGSSAAQVGSDQQLNNLLQAAFSQAFVQCATHRKQKSKCTDDCPERMAAWHEYFQREKEKFEARRKAAAEQQQATGTPMSDVHQPATSNGGAAIAAGTAGVAASPVPATTSAAAAPSSSSSSSLPPATVASLPSAPLKKKRLVLYYSVVGPDGQLLLKQPVLEPEVVQKYVIATQGEEKEGEEHKQEQKQAEPQTVTEASAPHHSDATLQQGGAMQIDS